MIRVGFTEAHGMAVEASQSPPDGVEYSFLKPSGPGARWMRSPIKGYFGRYETREHDLIEAVLSPIATTSRWIYSCEDLPAAAAFSVYGAPLPRSLRIAWLKRILLKDNCRKIVFWSEAGRRTIASYAHIDDEQFLNRTTVVYPAVREAPDAQPGARDTREVRFLFSGDFFRKGGVNVVDAFERAHQKYPGIRLTLCCSEQIDFNTPNAALRAEYLAKIASTAGIESLGRIPRGQLLQTVLPQTDVYLLPTYNETFGMAVLEAMAFGLPVISMNHQAIPEMIEHEFSGLLVDSSRWDCQALFKGYVVNEIPEDFREHVTTQVYTYMSRLIESTELRRRLGVAGQRVARKKFSFETRNRMMIQIYQDALS